MESHDQNSPGICFQGLTSRQDRISRGRTDSTEYSSCCRQLERTNTGRSTDQQSAISNRGFIHLPSPLLTLNPPQLLCFNLSI